MVGDFTVENGPQNSAKVPSNVLKCKWAVMCLMEKIHVLDKFGLGISYSAIGCEFDVNESTYILSKMSLNRITHKTRLYIDG